MSQPLRVLMIEDSEDDALLIRRLLERAGHELSIQRVDTVEAFRSALADDHWDAILSDHSMPNFSASQALALLTATGRDIPFLIVSGHIGEEAAVAAMKGGAHDYVPKDRLARLVPALERELADAAERRARRRAEREVKEREVRLRAVLDTVGDAILTLDERKRIEMFNPAAEQIFGYTRAEVLGKSLSLLMPQAVGKTGDDEGVVGEVVGGFVASFPREGGAHPFWARRRDGAVFPIEFDVRPLALEDRKLTTLVVRDIGQRLAAERAKNEFLSCVSHELRTPLTSITGALQLLAGEVTGPLPAETRELVRAALDNSGRLSRLVNDLLDLEKIEAGRMDVRIGAVEPTELVGTALASMHPAANAARVHLASRIHHVGSIPGDRDRLLQVLTNLLSNAVKFSPAGGVVAVAVENAGDEHVRFSVEDQGPGIPPASLSLLFRKFQQIDSSDTRQKGGTGLGLAISKALVEQHGGRIGVETRRSAGSVFWFELPTSSPHQEGDPR